jgi:hypothetical protein
LNSDVRKALHSEGYKIHVFLAHVKHIMKGKRQVAFLKDESVLIDTINVCDADERWDDFKNLIKQVDMVKYDMAV